MVWSVVVVTEIKNDINYVKPTCLLPGTSKRLIVQKIQIEYISSILNHSNKVKYIATFSSLQYFQEFP